MQPYELEAVAADHDRETPPVDSVARIPWFGGTSATTDVRKLAGDETARRARCTSPCTNTASNGVGRWVGLSYDGPVVTRPGRAGAQRGRGRGALDNLRSEEKASTS